MKKSENLPTNKNLIPNRINPSPDYYCTWQTQLYATSDGKPIKQRENITEKALFDKEKPFGWAYFYEKSRKDLILVMDDSWDVPLDGNPDYYGSLILNHEKFPSFTGENISPEQSLKLLSDKLKALGWKGLGGWVCAQDSALFPENSEDEYWIKRLKWACVSEMAYWKVDWGRRGGDFEFRKKLSVLAKEFAPSLTVENAFVKDVIRYSSTYRTYDVPAIMSIPMTMEKLGVFLNIEPAADGFDGIINCEDEAYIAAALGCTMGIMRNPFVGNLPNRQPDPSFPDFHRRLKTKITEITRAVNWHKIAPAFGVDSSKTYSSDEILTDTWVFEDKNAEIEAWWLEMDTVKDYIKHGVLSKSATSAISRNMKLPTVTPDENGDIPFAVASQNPSGAISVATCGRTKERAYYIPRCTVEIEGKNADTFGIFGEYKELIISFDKKCTAEKILAQDLAGDISYDITELVKITDNRAVIPGDLIHEIGTSAQDENDTSEPGLIIKLLG